MKELKKYLVRTAKYTALFYALFLLIYAGMCIAHRVQPDTIHLFHPLLLSGILLLGLLTPFVQFSRMVADLPTGGRTVYEQKICEIIAGNGYRPQKTDGNILTFVATSKLCRILALHEARITLQFLNATTISISGQRRYIARIRQQLNDYLEKIA